MLQIVLGGPQSSETQARAALDSAGFTSIESHDPGLDEPGVVFLRVDGDDVDLANECVRGSGWRLRQHSQTVADAVVMPAVAVAPGVVRGDG